MHLADGRSGHRLRSGRAVVDSEALGGPREDGSARRDEVGAAVQVGGAHCRAADEAVRDVVRGRVGDFEQFKSGHQLSA